MSTKILLPEIASALVERKLEQLTFLHVSECEIQSKEKKYKPSKVLKGNGVFSLEKDHISGVFQGGQDSYQIKLLLPEPLDSANGITIRYRILDWTNLRYLAVGHTTKEGFRHVKIANPSEGEWITFSIGYQDLAFGLKNNWQKPCPEKISDICLYISGTPSEVGAKIEIMWASTWLEQSEQQPDWVKTKVNKELNGLIKKYFIRCNPYINKQAERFLNTGDCSLIGEVRLSWPIHMPKPDGIEETKTYRYLWHAMDPAVSMMVHAKNTDTTAPIYVARDYINNWLDRSFFSPDPDIKYTWYDHGTAERLLAFLFMHDIGIEQDFDYRFMARLKLAVFKHAQLLESEVFYASHQLTRYHNHAWFQDVALIATAVAMPEIPCASRWFDRGIDRLTGQFTQLIVRDNGYAVFVENSIGYHHGIQRLVEFAGELVRLSGRETDIPKIADELNAWSDFLRYPDGSIPSQGDTFRTPNLPSIDIKRGTPYSNPSCTILPVAGYAVVKGNHNQIPFMLCMFATSLCKTHKHEDNLSFTLFFDGIEWLIDPSFYSHEYDSDIPSYLRSAWAHNNVVIANTEYSIAPGKALLAGDCSGESYEIHGSHSAYDGFDVHRSLHGSTSLLELTVTDHIITEHKNDVEVFSLLHLGEAIKACITDEGVQLSHPDSEHGLLIYGAHLSAEIFEGWNEARKIQGVIGLGFMQKTNSTSIAFAMSLNRKFSLNIKCTKIV